MHEIERVAEESTTGREDGQRAHCGDKQAKPSPLNVSTAYLLNIFFGPASTVQRFNDLTLQRAAKLQCLDTTPFYVRQLLNVSMCVPLRPGRRRSRH